MSRALLVCFAAFILSCQPFSAAGAATVSPDAFAAPGPHGIEISEDIWRDTRRGREIAVRIYGPQGEGPFPAVIFSHGLGGSREAAPYLGEHLASWGIVAIHVQHPGSDAAIWQGSREPRRALQAGANAGAARDRYADIPFIVDTITARAAALDVDPSRLGIAGHSFGAHTVLAAAGLTYLTPRGPLSMGEPRLRAGMMLSPPAPPARLSPDDYSAAYSSVTMPLLHVTGVDDTSPLDDRLDPAARRIPFGQTGGERQYLIVFDPGDHAVFSGRQGRRPQPGWYQPVQGATAQAAAAFFRAELADDPAARAFMDGPDFRAAFAALGETGRRGD